MCIFSEEVKYVANTRIFARRADDGRQMLAYQMRYTSRHPVAMILPLPVKRQAQDKTPAVRFISLKSYPTFFEELDNAFPIPRSADDAGGGDGGDEPMDVLPVYHVGDFVASFVPTIADFKRLNKRFALPLQTWNKIPAYHDYGFAVFQLKAARAGKKAHPMALSFASRYSDRLFFPTVHIHDGHVHPREAFDHELYWQPRAVHRILGLFPTSPPGPEDARYVRPSDGSVGRFVDKTRARGLIASGMPGVKAGLIGMLQNRDTFVADTA